MANTRRPVLKVLAILWNCFPVFEISIILRIQEVESKERDGY